MSELLGECDHIDCMPDRCTDGRVVASPTNTYEVTFRLSVDLAAYAAEYDMEGEGRTDLERFPRYDLAGWMEAKAEELKDNAAFKSYGTVESAKIRCVEST